MKNIFFALLATSLFFTGICLGQEIDVPVVRLSLARSGGSLAVKIDNISNYHVKINKMLSMDPLVGVIHFVIKEKGVEKEFRGSINAEPLSEDSYIYLQPGSFYGGLFDIEIIEKMYGMSNSCYSLQAYYMDNNAKEFSAFDQKIFSNSVEICTEH